MIERIIRAASSMPLLTIIVSITAVVIGVVSFGDLRRDVFPDLAAPVFNVIVQNPAMGAEELEASIAIPMESAFAGLPGARRIRSSSHLGVVQLTIEFEPDADYFRARQFVVERMQQVSPQLPPGTEMPLLSSLSGRLNEIMELSLEADPGHADLMTLRDLAEFEIRNRLLAVPGVATVERLGGYLRQFQVELDPERMAARGVSLDEVMHAAQGANVNASGGFVTQGPMEWNVRAIGRVENADDLRATVVAMRGEIPVLIGDVADVREGPALRRGIAHRLDGEIVSLRVVKQFGADTVRVSEGVRDALEEIRRGLPPGASLVVSYDQAELVRGSLEGVGRAVLLGALFVIVVLFVLLGNLRAASVVTCTLPISVAIAGVLLSRMNVGLNTMTLGGLAIAVGLLVDSSIIVIENIVHRSVGEGEDRRGRAIDAAIEVGRPIAFATLIVVAVFLPLLTIAGIEGRMYAPLAGAVIASMIASLAVALTLTPVLGARVVSANRSGDDVWIIRQLKRMYAPALDFCMRHSGVVRVASLALTVPAIVIGTQIGSDFMPELDEGALMVETRLPGEASLEEVDVLNHRLEDVLREFPEVVDVVRRTGRSEHTEDAMPHVNSDVLVMLDPNRTRSIAELTQAMRERTDDIPGLSIAFTTPLGMRIDEGLGGTPADLQVRIFGPDLEVLARLAPIAREAIEDVQGLEDVRAEQVSGLPQIGVRIDRPAVARVGLTPGDVVRALRIALVGEEVGEVYRGARRFSLVVRLDDRVRRDPVALRGLLIDAHDGTRVPLGQLAQIEETVGVGVIRRQAGSRRIAIEASVEGRDLAGAVDDVRSRLNSVLQPTLENGYFFDVGGRIESQERAVRSLTLAIAWAAIAVFVLLYLALRSFLDTLVILLTLPDAFVGGIALLWISGETWNVSSLVGLIGLFGIAVQNGLVLVTQTRALLDAGKPFDEALREACLGRVRPKIMTAATAILGLLPLLVLRMHGTEIERPLAIVMIGGLVTSTAFTLLALPTFYAFVHRWRQRWERGASGSRS